MKLLKPNVDIDFSATALHQAIISFEHNELSISNFCLIISSGYLHHEILQSIFECRGKLDIPFEISYALHMDSWILINDKGDLYYSSGA